MDRSRDARDKAFDFFCLVDEPSQVDWLGREIARERLERPLSVLVELGYPGGRTGARSLEEAMSVVTAVQRNDALEFAGTEGFEGLLARPGDPISRVDRYLQSLRAFTDRVLDAGSAVSELIVSAGGSAAFDRVVEQLSDWDVDPPPRLVLRSGCYLTHDHSLYDQTAPFGSVRGHADGQMRPALELTAAVLSRPERSLAIVGAGRRDTSYDAGLPIVERVLSTGEFRDVRGQFTFTRIDDQHGYVEIPADDQLRGGDILTMGISHPCTAIERWPLLLVVDEQGVVIDGYLTFF